LVYLEVDVDDADVLGNEPVMDGEKVIGVTTSGAWGHTVGKELAFAYGEPGYAAPGTRFDIVIMNDRRRAAVLPDIAYDPSNERMRA
jgi:dimethylglycine dehydrogenase